MRSRTTGTKKARMENRSYAGADIGKREENTQSSLMTTSAGISNKENEQKGAIKTVSEGCEGTCRTFKE